MGKARYRPRFWGCGAHTSLVIYDPHGNIYPCYESVGSPQHAIGVYNPRLKFDEKKRQLWRSRTVFTIPECRQCNLAFFCGGGCAMMAYTETGSIIKPHCDYTKSIVNYVIPFLYHQSQIK